MSTECEYPVTILGNPPETIDVSEVADFSASQRQQAKAETSRKKGCRGCVSSVRGLAGKSEASDLSQGRLPLGTARRDLLRCRDGKGEDDLGQAMLVPGARVTGSELQL